MRKYMKYEIKGSYKFILGVIAIVLIASTIIQLNMSRAINYAASESMGRVSSGFQGLILIVSILTIFGTFLTAFLHIIGSFKKELYEDTGYLTFTLPLTGNQILGTKLIIALLWFFVLGFSIVIYNLLLGTILFNIRWLEVVSNISRAVDFSLLSIAITSTIAVIMTLTLIYFSVALSKVSIRNKKIGGLWFVIFLILNSFTGYLVLKIGTIFPYYLDLSNFHILNQSHLGTPLGFTSTMIGQLIIGSTNSNVAINIAGSLAQILISVLAFIFTGYLMENKIDL